MTDKELQAIYEQQCSHEKGLRAVFNAGTESALDIDQINDEEIAEVLRDGLHHSRAADAADCDCNSGDLVSDGRR